MSCNRHMVVYVSQSGIHVVLRVQMWKGEAQPMEVVRAGDRHMLHLTPAEWSGRGLLGCIMAPL